MNRKKVAVGLSGGVDSAVSALLLKKAGFDVVGVHLYCWPPKSEIEKEGMSKDPANSYAVRRAGWMRKNGCRADEDRAAALKTALELSIPFKVLDFSEEYNERVISYFYSEYEKGRTPNPDVLCNSEIKFGLFLDWALENGFDYVATGHYAKKSYDGSGLPPVSLLENGNLSKIENGLWPACRLFIPKDKHKDQTYFLWKLTQKELAHVLFPLGDYLKSEVREMAREAGLSVAERKDSQGICFVGSVDVKEFLARRLKDMPGKVVNINGEVVGSHDGVWHYTIGERGGWQIDPEAQNRMMKAGKTPILYVIKKDVERNELVVGEADEAEENSFEVRGINWITDLTPDPRALPAGRQGYSLKVRIRHGGELVRARVVQNNGEGREMDSLVDDGIYKNKMTIVLEKAVRGIASGQSAVYYTEDGECVGGGVID